MIGVKFGAIADNLFADETCALIGTTDQIVAQLKALNDIGFEYVILTMPQKAETIRIFAAEIMPRVEGMTARLAAE